MKGEAGGGRDDEMSGELVSVEEKSEWSCFTTMREWIDSRARLPLVVKRIRC